MIRHKMKCPICRNTEIKVDFLIEPDSISAPGYISIEDVDCECWCFDSPYLTNSYDEILRAQIEELVAARKL